MMWKWLSRLLIGMLCLFLLSASQSTAAPSTVPPFPANVAVNMFKLDPTHGGVSTEQPCLPGDTSYGCTAFCSDYPQYCETGRPAVGYPYPSSTTAVPIETYYLLDVALQEMEPSSSPVALQAQVIASRSYLGWFLNNASDDIGNSSAHQVFIPYKFDSLNPTAPLLEPGRLDPCGSNDLNEAQQKVCGAIAPPRYIARSDVDLPAFAEFSADAYLNTLTNTTDNDGDGQLDFPYLVGVADPISYDPAILAIIAQTNAHQRGLSQNGANRWAYGNASRYGTSEAWTVQWFSPTQILVHYYTNVHVRDAANGNAILTPDYRWNPLSIENVPLCIDLDAPPTIRVRVQNTGTRDWYCSAEPGQEDYFTLHARLELLGSASSAPEAGESTTDRGNVCNLAMGDDVSRIVTIDNIAAIPPSGGRYRLRFDVLYDNDYGAGHFWFSEQGALDWPAYEIEVDVETCSWLFLPLTLKDC